MKRPRKHIQPRGNVARCPACGQKCRTVKTRLLSASVTEITYICLSSDCELVWVAQVYPIRVLSPSALPPERHLTPLPAAGAGG